MREQRLMRVYNRLRGLVAIWNKRSQHDSFNKEKKTRKKHFGSLKRNFSSGHQSRELASSILYTAAVIEGTWKISYDRLFDTKYTSRDWLHCEEQRPAIIVGGHCKLTYVMAYKGGVTETVLSYAWKYISREKHSLPVHKPVLLL